MNEEKKKTKIHLQKDSNRFVFQCVARHVALWWRTPSSIFISRGSGALRHPLPLRAGDCQSVTVHIQMHFMANKIYHSYSRALFAYLAHDLIAFRRWQCIYHIRVEEFVLLVVVPSSAVWHRVVVAIER